MRLTTPISLAAFIFLALPDLAAGQASQPATDKDAAAGKVLDQAEANSAAIDSAQADLTHDRFQNIGKENTIRQGSVRFLRVWEKDPHARPATRPADGPTASQPHAGLRERICYRLQFDSLQQGKGGPVFKSTEIYSFDGRVLHELNSKTKQLVHHELAPEGQLARPAGLGKGPFPVLWGQKKKDVLDAFRVKLAPASQSDPKDTDHLELVPRPKTDLADKYHQVDMFISRTLGLPARMVLDEKSDEITTVDFKNIVANPKQAVEEFVLKPPKGEKCTEITEPFKPAPPGN
jgi:hypothetical protein